MIATAGAALASRTAAPALAQVRSTVRFVPVLDLNGIDPIWTTSISVRTHGYLVYDTLFGTDAARQVRPQMAEGFETSPDGRTTTIWLRPGLVFHDGTPVLARDCVASVRRWAARSAGGQLILAVTEELSAPDDLTIRFRLVTPLPMLVPLLGQLASPPPFIMPERVARTDPHARITDPTGSGPFRFLPNEWVQGSRVAYERFDGYQPRPEPPSGTTGGKRAVVDRVEWHVISDASTAVAALQRGEVDWCEAVPADLLPVLRRHADVVISTLDPVGFPVVMRLNHLQPPFDNPALRRAVLAAVDQESFLLGGVGDASLIRPCHSFFPCGTDLVAGPGSAAMGGNVEAARRLVMTSGYDGTPAVILAHTTPVLQQMAMLAADLLRRIGIAVDLQVMDAPTMVRRRTSTDPVSRGGWSMFLVWLESAQTENPLAHIALGGEGRAAWPGWPTSSRIEALKREWAATSEVDERRRIAAALEHEALRVVPYIPLGQFRQPTAHRRNLSAPLAAGFPLFWNLRKA
jgi:peptide/nickel transport system substrate-binding protein